MNTRNVNFVVRLRDQVTKFLDEYENLQGLLDQWTYLDYDNTLADTDVHPASMIEENLDIELADVVAAVNTITALKTAMDNNHGTNLYNLRR